MKRETLPGASRVGNPEAHRFPRGTLCVSVCLLVGGLRLADVLPVPSLPRFSLSAAREASLMPSAIVPAELLRSGAPTKPLTAQDITYQPIRIPLEPLSSRVGLTARSGQIHLTDMQKQATIWAGPTAQARFTYSDIGATRVLTDYRGRVLWSEMPSPDLRLEKQAGGETRLTDRAGQTLWAGTLRPTAMPARSRRRGTTYTIDFAGLQIRGINGYFSVIDETGGAAKILWSGTLPSQPLLLLRDQHRYLYWGVRGPENGADHVTAISLAEETGQVTVTDVQSRLVDRKPVALLTVDSVVRLVGENRTIPVPSQYYVPYANLTKDGVALFAYQNRAGVTIHKNSIFREGGRQHINNNRGVSY